MIATPPRGAHIMLPTTPVNPPTAMRIPTRHLGTSLHRIVSYPWATPIVAAKGAIMNPTFRYRIHARLLITDYDGQKRFARSLTRDYVLEKIS